MLNGKNCLITTVILFVLTGLSFSQDLESNWNDYLHFTIIGRFDLASGYAKAILSENPDPEKLLDLSIENQQGYQILLKVVESNPNEELTQLSKQILELIEQGRFNRRRSPKIIIEEIKRLSSNERGRLAGLRRLQNSGEYSIMYILDAMADRSRQDEFANLIWALPQIGRDAIRPLAAALQMDDMRVKTEIIKALGKIGYVQSLPYLKYIVENDESSELRALASASMRQIDKNSVNRSAAELFYELGEKYYYNSESLEPVEQSNSANMWFWDKENKRLEREQVDRKYFNELMAMRCCEWSLKSDASFGSAIGLWLASYFKAESTGIEMPPYFGERHADAMTYATTAGPEYLHQALGRAIKDRNAYVALGAIEALAKISGEKSLLFRIGPRQPLTEALKFYDRAVRYSAAIAIASAGPKYKFPESNMVAEILSQALDQTPIVPDVNESEWGQMLADSYAYRAADALLNLAQTHNEVIDLSLTENALISATKDKRSRLQLYAGKILTRLGSPQAQRAIAEMALNEANSEDIRIAGFESLAQSAKNNGNLLENETIDTIYKLISSEKMASKIGAAAAAAYGSLNLPSLKVKDLILDQSKS